MFVGGIEK